jgi:hypothetical protein
LSISVVKETSSLFRIYFQFSANSSLRKIYRLRYAIKCLLFFIDPQLNLTQLEKITTIFHSRNFFWHVSNQTSFNILIFLLISCDDWDGKTVWWRLVKRCLNEIFFYLNFSLQAWILRFSLCCLKIFQLFQLHFSSHFQFDSLFTEFSLQCSLIIFIQFFLLILALFLSDLSFCSNSSVFCKVFP